MSFENTLVVLRDADVEDLRLTLSQIGARVAADVIARKSDGSVVDFATEATLAALTGVDFATEATLQSVLSTLGSPAQEHATAGNPLSARLSDGSSYLGTTSGRLHVSVENPASSGAYVRPGTSAVFPISATTLPLPSGAATSANQSTANAALAAIQAAVEKLDNQEDEVSDVTVSKSTTDGDIIATPGSGHHLRIHHIGVSNGGPNMVKFHIRKGSGGNILRTFPLAPEGGIAEANFKRPVGLPANTALYYDWVSGASADVSISVHYEDITD